MGRSRFQNKKFIKDIYLHPYYQNTLSKEGLDLVATSGFDLATRSDVDVFTEIAEDVLHRKSVDQHLVGIVIIYPSEDRIYSGALQRILKGLVELFLGERNLDRLTILVTRVDPNEKDPDAVVRSMRKQSQQAPIFDEFISGGATIAVLKVDLLKPLKHYFSQGPLSPPISQYDTSQQSIRMRVEVALGYSPKESVDMWTPLDQKELAETLKKSEEMAVRYQRELERTSQSLDQINADQLQLLTKQQKLEEEVVYYRRECERLAQLPTNQLQVNQQQINRHVHDPETRVSQLTQRLQQAEAEYASLRSQVQLQNNYEQGEISRDLKNLNSMIERLGQTISEYMVDSYVEAAFCRDPDDVTTLDASNLFMLKDMFGHREGSPSLVASADGTGLNIENFIDFSIRSQVCHSLVKYLFEPFHPFIDPVDSSKHTAIYEQIQRTEPQYTAGKWRAITFKNAYQLSGPCKPAAEDIDALAHRILKSFIEPLAKGVFGWPVKKLGITKQQFVDLKEIIIMAWEWSSKVKEEVIMLGDFQPTTLDARKGPAHFDSRSMEDFEPTARGPRPRVALCTLGLGLNSRQARGGGESPKETIVHKMAVLTDIYYENA